METRAFDIRWSTLFKILAAVFLGWSIFVARDVLFAFFIAFILSLVFDPIVDFFERRKVPRVLTTLILFLVTLFVIAFIFYIIFPLAVAELRQLIVSFYSEQVPFLNFIRETYYFQEEILKHLNEFFGDFLKGRSLINVAGNVLGSISLTFFTLALAFYLTAGRDAVEKFTLFVSPPRYESRIMALYDRIKKKVMLWSLGQLILSLSVGSLVALGLFVLGIKYSFLLGVLAAIFELIPIAGPVFVGAIAVILALNESVSTAVIVLVFFIAVQQLENNFLTPIVNRFTTGLNPAAILVAIVIAVKIFGLAGIIIAVPVAILVRELLEEMSAARRTNESK